MTNEMQPFLEGGMAESGGEWLQEVKNAGVDAQKLSKAITQFLENDGEVSQQEIESLTNTVAAELTMAGSYLNAEQLTKLKGDFSAVEGAVVDAAIKADILGFREANAAVHRGKNVQAVEDSSGVARIQLRPPEELGDEERAAWLLDRIAEAKMDIKFYDGRRRDILASTKPGTNRLQQFARAKEELGSPFTRLQILKNQYIELMGRDAYKNHLVQTGDLQIIDATRGRAEWEAQQAAQKQAFVSVMRDNDLANKNMTTLPRMRMMRQFAEEGLLPHQQISSTYAINMIGTPVGDQIRNGRPQDAPRSVTFDRTDAGKKKKDLTEEHSYFSGDGNAQYDARTKGHINQMGEKYWSSVEKAHRRSAALDRDELLKAYNQLMDNPHYKANDTRDIIGRKNALLASQMRDALSKENYKEYASLLSQFEQVSRPIAMREYYSPVVSPENEPKNAPSASIHLVNERTNMRFSTEYRVNIVNEQTKESVVLRPMSPDFGLTLDESAWLKKNGIVLSAYRQLEPVPGATVQYPIRDLKIFNTNADRTFHIEDSTSAVWHLNKASPGSDFKLPSSSVRAKEEEGEVEQREAEKIKLTASETVRQTLSEYTCEVEPFGENEIRLVFTGAEAPIVVYVNNETNTIGRVFFSSIQVDMRHLDRSASLENQAKQIMDIISSQSEAKRLVNNDNINEESTEVLDSKIAEALVKQQSLASELQDTMRDTNLRLSTPKVIPHDMEHNYATVTMEITREGDADALGYIVVFHDHISVYRAKEGNIDLNGRRRVFNIEELGKGALIQQVQEYVSEEFPVSEEKEEKPTPKPTQPEQDEKNKTLLVGTEKQRFGDALRISDEMSPEVALHIAHLAKVPDGLIRALRLRGVSVQLSSRDVPGMSADPKWKRGAPRAWKQESWDGIPGAFDTHDRIVYAGKGRHGCSSLVLHEFGHAIGQELHQNTALAVREAHERLFNRLREYYRQEGDAGRQEFFAESFGDYFVHSKVEFIKEYDEEWYNYLDSFVNQYQ